MSWGWQNVLGPNIPASHSQQISGISPLDLLYKSRADSSHSCGFSFAAMYSGGSQGPAEFPTSTCVIWRFIYLKMLPGALKLSVY